MFRLKIGHKLLLGFLFLGIAPFALIGHYALTNASEALDQQSRNHLISVTRMKKDHVESFFNDRRTALKALVETVRVLRQEAFRRLTVAQEVNAARLENRFDKIRNDVSLLAKSQDVLQAFVKIRTYKDGYDDERGEILETIDVSTDYYQQIHDYLSPYFQRFKDIHGYANILLVDLEYGNVIFDVKAEHELGANLNLGPLTDTGLGRVFQRAAETKAFVFEDFAPYPTSGDAQSAFVAMPVEDAFERVVAVAVFEISAGTIQSIVGRHEGLGRSGQTMLVDREGGELVMRSTWAGQAHMGDTITSWAPGFVAAAADGDHGRLVHTDEGGHTRIAVYQPIDVFDDQWAIISTMDLAEAIDPHLEGAERDFLTQYIEQYGFGDLLLITPEGQIFYSAAKHGDHGANLRSGPLRDTNLGDLFERVVESGEFRFADLAAYPPHNHRPAAFMAQPVTSSRGIEVVVAVALSHEDFNAIMHQRSGLGQTGQAYLVGPDKLMRSDAQSSSKRHSVLASFANPGKGRMDTAAVREALSGDSGARRIENAAGQAVMAAYAPVNLADRTWALVADLKMEEALAAIDRLKSTLTLAAGGLVIVILIAAWLLARSLANPLRRSVRTLKDMDQGDFRNRLDVRSGDEVGELAGKFNSVLEALGAIIGRLRDNVAQLGRASGEMDTVSEDMADGAREMSARTEELGDSSKEVRGLMDGIARATDELSGNVKATADAVEEMSESMLQVSQNAGASASAAQAAAASAEATSDLVAQLRSSAQEVGQVVDLIGEVAFQTNMLAINASLEAARAGSSGKGFSVVAAEVKRLAGQTAESTDVIRLKIEAMQNNTAQVSQAMTDIVDRIQTATRQAERIAAAMDEQTKTARNISSNVAQAADRADDVSSNTAQAAQVSSSMMQNIDQVANAARLTSDGSERVRRSSVTLYDLTAQMQELITKFQV